MSSNNNYQGPEMMIGAVILILALSVIVIRALKSFFIELARAFDAFAGMVGSFISILWNTAQVVGLISLIIFSVFCAIYFTLQYYQMVKEGTALREWTKNNLSEFEKSIVNRFERLEIDISADVRDMDHRLTEALKKPEVAPEAEEDINSSSEDAIENQHIREANNNDLTVTTIDDSGSEESIGATSSNAETHTESSRTNNLDTKTPEVTMSNPY